VRCSISPMPSPRSVDAMRCEPCSEFRAAACWRKAGPFALLPVTVVWSAPVHPASPSKRVGSRDALRATHPGKHPEALGSREALM